LQTVKLCHTNYIVGTQNSVKFCHTSLMGYQQASSSTSINIVYPGTYTIGLTSLAITSGACLKTVTEQALTIKGHEHTTVCEVLMGSLIDLNDVVLPRNKVLPFTGKLVLKLGIDTSETSTALPKAGFGNWKGSDNRTLSTELVDTNVGPNAGLSRVEDDEPK